MNADSSSSSSSSSSWSSLSSILHSFKIQGNQEFEKNEFELAIQTYTRALDLLTSFPTHPTEEQEQDKEEEEIKTRQLLWATLLSNRATCFWKLYSLSDQVDRPFSNKEKQQQWLHSCIQDTTQAFSIVPNLQTWSSSLYIKLLFRRAQARYSVYQFKFMSESSIDTSTTIPLPNVTPTEKEEEQDEEKRRRNQEQSWNEMFQDVQMILSLDSKHSQAISFLQRIQRERYVDIMHKSSVRQTMTPMGHSLRSLQQVWNRSPQNHTTEGQEKESSHMDWFLVFQSLQRLMSHLSQVEDWNTCLLEFQRCHGFHLLLDIVLFHISSLNSDSSSSSLSTSTPLSEQDHRKHMFPAKILTWHILSLLCSHDAFVHDMIFTPWIRSNQEKEEEKDHQDPHQQQQQQQQQNHSKENIPIQSPFHLSSILNSLLHTLEFVQEQMITHGQHCSNSWTVLWTDDTFSTSLFNSCVAGIGFLLRILLQVYLYEDSFHSLPSTENHTSILDPSSICQFCVSFLQVSQSIRFHSQKFSSIPSSSSLWVSPSCFSSLSTHIQVDLAIFDLLLAWTTSDLQILTSMANDASHVYSSSSASSSHSHWSTSTKDNPTNQPHPKPQDLAADRKRIYQQKQRSIERSKHNSILFCQQGGLVALLSCAISSDHRSYVRQCVSTMSKLMAPIEEVETIRQLVRIPLGWNPQHSNATENHVTIEIVHEKDDDDDEEKSECSFETMDESRLHEYMKRALLTTALLHCNGDVGTWALSEGWSNGQGLTELMDLIESEQPKAQIIASELLCAAASMESSRKLLSSILRVESLQTLLQSKDSDVSSAIASTFAKLGLADKTLSSDEGEVFSLLEVATNLLDGKMVEEREKIISGHSHIMKRFNNNKPGEQNEPMSTTVGSVAVQRGIEILSYIATKTFIKDEIAHGYKGPSSTHSVIDKLVELCSSSIGGVEAYGLASIFSSLLVSNEILRKEAFIGKDITAEQYDHLQSLGKTEQERNLEKEKVDHDPPKAVRERIQKLANKNVARAMVALIENSSGTTTTMEYVILGMLRMAEEESVRGVMIQQGVLTTCIEISSEEKYRTSLGNKLHRMAQHCIAKLLVTTNPCLLTMPQTMGSIKPLMLLVKDSDSTDLQQFESLLSLTNLASVGDETKEKIISEKGISIFSGAMFSDHGMVRRAATEAMSNLLPHLKVLEYLRSSSNLRLWIAFAMDFEQNPECSRAASGCLAMAAVDSGVALTLCTASHFEEMVRMLLECGDLEIMHRILVLLLNLIGNGSKCLDAVLKTGAHAFCEAYVQTYTDGEKAKKLGMNVSDISRLTLTVELAKELVRNCR